MSKLLLLLKVDLKRTFDLNKLKKFTDNKFKTAGVAILALYVILSILGTMGIYTYMGINYLAEYGLQQYVLPLMYFIVSSIIFYTTIYKAKSYLFNTDDVLFAMPIKPITVLTSRLISLTLLNYLITTIVFIPATVTYGVIFNLGIQFYIFAFLALLFTPFVPTILGSIFGYLIGYITSKLGNKKVLESVLTYGVVLLIVYAFMNLQTLALKFVDNVETVNKLMNNIGFLINNFMLMLSEYSIKDSLTFILTNIGVFALFIIVFQGSYVKILQNLKVQRTKNNYVHKEHNKKGVVSTLLVKEFKTFISIPIYILNTTFGIVLMLFASLATLFYDKEMIFKMLEIEAGSFSIYTLIIAIIAFSTAMSNTAACSISIEGKNFWILKTMPIKTTDIFLSKILLNILVIFPLITLAIILLGISLKLTLMQIVIAILLTLITNVTYSMFGVIINLKFPRLDFVSHTHVVKQSMSAFIGICGPLLLSILMGLIFMALNISIYTYVLIIMTLLLVVIMIQYNILKNWGVKRFKEIN